jgi:hypothetical protein
MGGEKRSPVENWFKKNFIGIPINGNRKTFSLNEDSFKLDLALKCAMTISG